MTLKPPAIRLILPADVQFKHLRLMLVRSLESHVSDDTHVICRHACSRQCVLKVGFYEIMVDEWDDLFVEV